MFYKRNIFIIPLIYLCACLSLNENVWLNRFDVCCKIDNELKRDGKNLDFSNGFFKDRYVSFSFDYDILNGIKIKILSQCLTISEIDWDKAIYIDEKGNERKVEIKQQMTLAEKKSNITVVSPYTETEVVLLPAGSAFKQKGVWNYKPLLDYNINPEFLKGKTVSLFFSMPCDEDIYKYTANFKIIPRY